MGNTTTKDKKPHNLVKDLDQIATKLHSNNTLPRFSLTRKKGILQQTGDSNIKNFQ